MRYSWIVASLVGFPLPLVADTVNFDDSFLFSSLAFASSQSYQIKGQNCELGMTLSRGNLVSKTIDMTLEAKSQGGALHCGQSLENSSVVIGIQAGIVQSTMDGVIVRFEELTTRYQPYIAFQLSDKLSLGVSEDVEMGENKTHAGRVATNAQRLLLSASWHDGPWETTLSYADRYRDTLNSSADLPRSLGFAARYQLSPLLTAGLIYSRTDYPGIATDDESLEIGQDVILAFATNLTEAFQLEYSYMAEISPQGNDDAQSGIIGLVGQYRFNPKLKLAAFINQFKGKDDALDISMTAFGFSLAMSR